MPSAEQYLKVLRGDALDCLQNLALLEAMQQAKNELGISGHHPSAALYNQVARNAQIVALTSLARLFDNGRDAISLKRARSTQILKQPKNTRDLWKQFERRILINLKGWRNNLLAHSLVRQTEEAIDEVFPITPAEIEGVLKVAVELINLYSELNRVGSVWYKIVWEREFDRCSEDVKKMVGALFN